ncbi:haloalkane dehalogenase [Mycobacterium kansasii]|uniref:Haloalkane dehalogenase n=1 Tax=Mycobacterium kansasii TaxID=1768 RepID=A0A1V3XBI0_MYCKA|nr:haloalkane dehalogenase [Mycobacterium kansasii]
MVLSVSQDDSGPGRRGHRVICPDLVGFGRSDKPTRREDHSYARHVEWMRALAFDVLDLRNVTLVGQDWGGLIGLRLAAEHPERFARLVVANTGLPNGISRWPRSGGVSGKRSRPRRSWTSAGSCRGDAGGR